jgi:hypothetical protein
MPERLKIGFTGTRGGMTVDQTTKFVRFIRQYIGEFHNGYAEGSDEDALRTVDHMGGFTLHIHPPKNKKYIAHYQPRHSEVVWYEEDEYGERDRQIVVASDVMVATPSGKVEIKRGSGTWLTVRIARVELKPLLIIFDDGTTKYERWPKKWPKRI